MAKLMKLTFLFAINILLIQFCECKREKRGITSYLIPAINVGDMAVEYVTDLLKTVIYGTPVDKDQVIIDKQVEHMDVTREILSLTHDIAVSAANAPEMSVLIEALQSVPKYLNSIDDAFRQYEMYENAERNSSEYQVREFAKYSNNRYIGLFKDLRDLYSISIPSEIRRRTVKADYSIISLISKQMKGYQKLCDKFKSQRQIMQTLLDSITVCEIKVFFVMEFSIRTLAEIKNINYQKEVDQLKSDLVKRLERLATTFQFFMKDASGEVWRCDPDHYIEGETYFKLGNLFQLYIVRDADLNYADGDCYYKCGDFTKAVETSCSSRSQKYDPNTGNMQYSACSAVRTCKGFVYECTDKFAAFSELWTCPSDQSTNNTRRYDFIEHGNINSLLNIRNIRRYGPLSSGYCEKELTYNFRNWDRRFRVCESCACICDDSIASYSDKKINIRPVTADKDYVVTGIKWVKKDHTLNLQIEQGKVLSNGKIDYTTVHWKEIQEARKKPADDVVNLNWEEIRGFLLQDIRVAEGNVVAGVRLQIAYTNNKGFVTLQLLPVRYDYDSGKLDYQYPVYEDPDESTYEEGVWDDVIELPKKFSNEDVVNLGEAKVPSDSKLLSVPVGNSKKYVQLTTSHFQTDLGQNTVPFFDMQENILSAPTPLSGIGIYFKKKGDYAGFLGLKLLTINNTIHI